MTSLLEMWIYSHDFLESKTVDQVIAISGNGKLLDASQTSIDFRDLLSNVPSPLLVKYADNCLQQPFEQSGLALQDVVNEIGKRLGFIVEHGYYRGGKSKIGFDGIWKTEDGYSFVIEVKTTSAYQIDLDIQANCRDRLIQELKITKDKSSILVIVGRNDTGGLEAQTRGSRHAWDVRIISIDALVKLLSLKEDISEKKTLETMHEILKPIEYTRVDRLVEFVFATTEDIKNEELEIDVEIQEGETQTIEDAPSRAGFHEDCISAISKKLAVPLIRQGKAKYSSADQRIRVICVVSKEYQRSNTHRYWYAFHPTQKAYLEEGSQSFIALGCGSADLVFLIPTDYFVSLLQKMRTTENKNRKYWHIEVFKDGEDFRLISPGKDGILISKYKI